MDTHRLLNCNRLKFIWTANPKWHSIIAAIAAVFVLIGELLLSGDRAIARLMKRLYLLTPKVTREYTRLRFAYLYHYYSIRSLYSYGWLLYSPVEEINREMAEAKILGLQYLRKALGADTAILVFSAHVGCFFNLLFCRHITELCRGRKVNLLSPGTLEKRKQRMAVQLGKACDGVVCKLVDIELRTNAIAVHRALKKKEVVACTLDYAYPFTKNTAVRFLGSEVEFPIGVIELGRRVGITFLPSFSYLKKGRIVFEFLEPFSSVCTEFAEKDIELMAIRVNDVLEKKICEIPEQWSFWPRLANAGAAGPTAG